MLRASITFDASTNPSSDAKTMSKTRRPKKKDPIDGIVFRACAARARHANNKNTKQQ
jgi:hypothetical protein